MRLWVIYTEGNALQILLSYLSPIIVKQVIYFKSLGLAVSILCINLCPVKLEWEDQQLPNNNQDSW